MMFTDPGERTRAIGVFSFTASAGGAIGLLLGGIITQSIGWHWAFLVNVPVGVATILIARRVVKAPPGIGFARRRRSLRRVHDHRIADALRLRGRADSRARHHIAGNSHVYRVFVCTVRRVCRAAGHGVLPALLLRLFRSRNIAAANVIEALLSAGLFGFFFLDALYLRRTHGYGVLETGLAFLPLTITKSALSLGWAERLVTRFGANGSWPAVARWLRSGCSGLCSPRSDGNYLITTFPPMVLIGIGMGVAFPPLDAVCDVRYDRRPCRRCLRRARDVFGGRRRRGRPCDPAAITATGGFHTAFIAAGACVLVATLVAVLVLRRAYIPSSSSSPTSSPYPEKTLVQSTDSQT